MERRSTAFFPGTQERLRRRVLLGLERGLYWSGTARAYTALCVPAGATILMYHSVAGPDTAPFVDPRMHLSAEAFRSQMRFLAKRRRVISLNELTETLRKGDRPATGSVVLTFDDGYLDNLEIAAPILQEYRLPATLYLATGYVDSSETQWVDRLYTMFSCRTRDQLAIADLDASPFVLSRPNVMQKAYGALCDRLLTAQRSEREPILKEVEHQLAPSAQPPRLTMTWDDVRRLVRDHPNFELGVHTADHEDLTAHGLDFARAQVRRSIDDVELHTGVRATHFSFPYSRHSADTRLMVRELGLGSAVGSGTEYLVDRDSDPFALPRIDPPRSRTLFRFWTSGAYPGLPLALFGRA